MSSPCCRETSLIRLFAALILLTGSQISRGAAPVVQSHNVSTQPRGIVYNAAELRPIVQAAETRRIDIIGIGDSNQIAGPNNDNGWDHAYPKAWSDRFGLYATGLFGMNAAGNWVGGEGYLDSWGGPYGGFNNGVPADLHKFRLYYDSQPDNVDDFPASYSYFPPGFTESTQLWQPTLVIKRGGKLYGQNLTWRMTYGTFGTGTGGFTPAAVAPGYGQALVTLPRISTNGGAVGLRDMELRIGASQYQNIPTDLDFATSGYTAGTMQGPFFGLWQRVEGDHTSGIAYSTMLSQGGRALVHAATALKTQTNDAIQQYLRSAVQLQHGDPMLLVQVAHGGNDAGQTIPSVGPNPAPSDTPAGFADDMHEIVLRLRSNWISLGFNPANLKFQYGPYHPHSGETYDGSGVTAVQRLADWEDSIVNLSQQHPEYHIAVVRGTRLTTPMTMHEKDWYEPPGEAHLKNPGYEGFADLAVMQTVAYATPETVTNGSTVTSLSFTFDQDVSSLLSSPQLSLHEIESGADIDPSLYAIDWNASTKTATWTFEGLPLGELPVGSYNGTLFATSLGAAADYHFSFTAVHNPEPASVGVLSIAFLAALRRRR